MRFYIYIYFINHNYNNKIKNIKDINIIYRKILNYNINTNLYNIIFYNIINSITLISMNKKNIILHSLYEVFAVVYHVTLPRELLCKSLCVKWRCSEIRDDVDMIVDTRI